MSTTIRFGTTSGPSRVAAAWRAQLPEDSAEKEDGDLDKLLQCPFDKNHQIRTSRFPYHLLKCRKNHPELASELKTCPFNARHLVPKHELSYHTETCEDRKSVSAEDCGSSSVNHKWEVPINVSVDQNMTEDWEEEADDSAAPFVWGESTNLLDAQETRPSNNDEPSFRSPTSLPWSGV